MSLKKESKGSALLNTPFCVRFEKNSDFGPHEFLDPDQREGK
jgi:hypothetical protein